MLASTGSSCQTKRPVAPKLLEIEGQASDRSTLRTRLVDFMRRIADHDGAVVDAHFGERRRRAAPASGCAPALRSGRTSSSSPLASRSIAMVGRTSATSAISTRPISSGKNRKRAVSRSAVSAGRPGVAEHDVGETDAAGRKQRDGGLAAQDRVEAGDGADLGHRLIAHGIGRDQAGSPVVSTPTPAANTASRTIPGVLSRWRPSKGENPVFRHRSPADYTIGSRQANRGRRSVTLSWHGREAYRGEIKLTEPTPPDSPALWHRRSRRSSS